MQNHPAIFFILLLLMAALVGEYFVYLYFDPLTAIQEMDKVALMLLKLADKAGLLFRGGFIVIYLLWIISSQSLHTNRKGLGNSTFLNVLMAAGFFVCCFLLLNLQKYPVAFIFYLYPLSFAGIIFTGMFLAPVLTPNTTKPFGIKNEKRLLKNEYSFNFKTKEGYINVPNPFRGIFISGSAGAGKTVSLAYPIIHQAIQKGYTGLVYDFKFPVLAEQVHAALVERDRKGISYYLVNFHDLSRSHRLNPIKPSLMPVTAYAEEYSLAILNNLMPETIRKKDFWIRSANAILTAVIWFLKKNHPECCTIPHAVNIILHKDYLRVMDMLETDPETAGMVRSAITAIENEAEGQVAGVIGSLQISIARVNSPEICWVLSGDDFDLSLNDPSHPKILVVGTDPALVDAFSPVISCIITVALKLMNKPGKLPSIVLLDEAPTLYIPRLEMIPATARSNKIATVYMAQDYSQIVDSYGREKADVIIANLNNQFYGRVSSGGSAKTVSELFGREEKEMESRSAGQSQAGTRLSNNQSVSLNSQEKLVVRPQDLVNLQVGEFVGTTVESGRPYFWGKVKAKDGFDDSYGIRPFAFNVDVQGNFEKVRKEAEMIVNSYGKRLMKPAKARRRI